MTRSSWLKARGKRIFAQPSQIGERRPHRAIAALGGAQAQIGIGVSDNKSLVEAFECLRIPRAESPDTRRSPPIPT
ncbi:MAG: hypothetical protein V9G98_10900 [Candidatus Competibacter sp.]